MSKTIKRNHKFANALKCYPKDSWKFYVLAEVEYEKIKITQKELS